MIEWNDDQGKTNFSVGFIANRTLFTVKKIRGPEVYRLDSHLGILHGGGGEFLICDTLEEAKAKAEELLKEWLDKAGLMVKPEKVEGKVAWCNTTRCHYWRKVSKDGDKWYVAGHCAYSEENPDYNLDCETYS